MSGSRTEKLLSVHRESSDSRFQLRLIFAPDAYQPGIEFWEDYEYYPRPDDPGREYGYGVRAPTESLAALVAFFEAKTGRAADPGESAEIRLVRAFQALVAAGELGDALGLRENRARVLAWFTEAGVATKPIEWVWFNHD